MLDIVIPFHVKKVKKFSLKFNKETFLGLKIKFLGHKKISKLCYMNSLEQCGNNKKLSTKLSTCVDKA